MIRFLYDSLHKTTEKRLAELIRADLDAGASAILLVPEQEAVSAERRMLEAFPPSAQLRFEVLNFSRLANRVFRQLGGLSHHTATPAVQALLMWHSLSELASDLTEYAASAAKDPALCELMLQLRAQCKRSLIAPEELLRAAEALPKDEPLAKKLFDIGLVLSNFDIRLKERFDDANDDLTRLAALLSKNGGSLFEKTHVYVHSFTDFTAQEHLVLSELFSAAPSVTVTLPLRAHGEQGLHLHASLDTERRLMRMAKELGRRVLVEAAPSKADGTAREYLASHLFKMDAEGAPLAMHGDGTLSLTVCPSPFEEASAAVAHVQRLLREGCRYRDIAVVVRDVTAWQGILDAAFEKEDIPCYISEKTDITVRPLIKLIAEAFRIKLYGWRAEDVVGYLKTGLCGVSPDDVNLFEEYVNVWSPRGESAYCQGDFTKNPDGLSARRTKRAERILEGANRARAALVPPLMLLFAELDAAKTAIECCRALYHYLQELKIAEQLKDEASARLQAGERREAEELSRLFSVTLDAIEAVASALGERKMTVMEFFDALKLVFARTDIGSIPTSADEVTIGSASMLRADHPRHVLVLGLNEGLFPQTANDSGLLSDAEKGRLAELGVELPAGSAKLSSDELFYLYRAFSAPSEGLYVSYATSTANGGAASPSIAISRVKQLFPTLREENYYNDPFAHIYTPSSALEALSELPRSTQAELVEFLEMEGYAGTKALHLPVSDPDAAVSEETAGLLFGKNSFNPTNLEKFSSCRFAYYCSKILRLREEPDSKVSFSEVGNFIHYVLEHVMRAVRADGFSFADYDDERIARLVSEICEDYKKDLLAAGGEPTARTNALFARLCELARLIVTGLFAEFEDSLFRPAFFELDLARGGSRAAVRSADGEEIPLSGKADRVDFWQAPDGAAYLRVADYKTGTRKFRESDVDKGFSLQMPLYLLALCRTPQPELARALGLPEGTKFRPAGVTYLSSALGSEITEQRRPKEEAMCDAVKRLSREGVIPEDSEVRHAISLSGDKTIVGDGKSATKVQLSPEGFEQFFDRLEKTITGIAKSMKSGSAKAEPHAHDGRVPCQYCAFAAVCRSAQKSNY